MWYSPWPPGNSELPAEEAAPEFAALSGVVGGDLDVHDLASHVCSSSVADLPTETEHEPESHRALDFVQSGS
jgi:hypothetical protein